MRESVMSAAPRMSMSALNQTDDPDRQVRIWLLSATTNKGVTFYRVAGRFVSSGQTWQVNRRYSEFLVLRDTLVKYFSRSMDTCPGCINYLHAINSFDFPKKHVFVSKSQLVINYRVKALRSFMNLLASWAFSNTPKCPTCGGFAFDIVRNFVLEGADGVGESSDMGYIRESFVVSTFTDAGRRSSLSRRNSFNPVSSSQTPQSQRRESQKQLLRHSSLQSTLQRRNSPDPLPLTSADAPRSSGTHRSTSTAAMNQPGSLSKRDGQSTTPPQQSSANDRGATAQNGSFMFYQDGVERGNSVSGSTSSQQAPRSSSSKHGILKNWSDVRNDRSQNNSYLSLGASSEGEERPVPVKSNNKNRNSSNKRTSAASSSRARSQNDSYFSLGASSAGSREAEEYGTAAHAGQGIGSNGRNPAHRDRSQNDSYLSLGASSDSGDLEEDFHSHHPTVMPSPPPRNSNVLYSSPPMARKNADPSLYKTKSSKQASSPPPHPSQKQQQRTQVKEKTKRAVTPVDDSSFVSDSFVDQSLRFDGMNRSSVDDTYDDEEEINVTGIALNVQPQLRKSTSGQGLWQQWELAKAG